MVKLFMVKKLLARLAGLEPATRGLGILKAYPNFVLGKDRIFDQGSFATITQTRATSCHTATARAVSGSIAAFIDVTLQMERAITSTTLFLNTMGK